MAPTADATLAAAMPASADEFTLDVRAVWADQPVAALQRSTSDNCGSTCSGTACNTSMSDVS
ncbi:FxLD family lanthipeptide [Rhizohabitans arisaemae]|uniref:FxLD family lanthipeptide n=1 Tax=Rhizohabitans arisaemae TaxID=2720610 RepID=UPI0024B06B8A|nr:FxLD family lanthipeptide [Rhizohabitans arisaemae]